MKQACSLASDCSGVSTKRVIFLESRGWKNWRDCLVCGSNHGCERERARKGERVREKEREKERERVRERERERERGREGERERGREGERERGREGEREREGE